jgi:hypothetical protein
MERMKANDPRVPRFSLRHLMGWLTAVSLLFGFAGNWIGYLSYLETTHGAIPLGTAHWSVFLAILLLATLFGLVVVMPAVAIALAIRANGPRSGRINEP